MEKDKTVVPKLLNERMDLKSLTIHTVFNVIDIIKSNQIPEISLSSNTKVILYTTIGTVQGNLIPNYEEDETKTVSFMHETIMEVRNDRVKDFESEGLSRLVNDSSLIALNDVIITPYSAPNISHKLAYFTLFPDQVVGITFGSTE